MSARARMSLSLDLDDKWAYLKTRGDERWSDFPSYLERVVPRILDFLDARGLRITFFIVGKDAAIAANAQVLGEIARRGHDVASHSFMHDPWLHLYDEAALESDIAQAEQAIEAVTGVRVEGFRGPGYSVSTAVLEVLARRGYRYDASAFPNLLNPLARAYFFARSDLDAEQREQRRALFGTVSDAFRPVGPYRWKLEDGALLELPVTTMPYLKLPMHFSYLLYAARFGERLALHYCRLSIALCRLHGTEPSVLLHPLDFLGEDDDPDLAFFPAMDVSAATKIDLLGRAIDLLVEHFEPCAMDEHTAAIVARAGLALREPHFSHERARPA